MIIKFQKETNQQSEAIKLLQADNSNKAEEIEALLVRIINDYFQYKLRLIFKLISGEKIRATVRSKKQMKNS